ncbi:MAG: hypothetical protein PHD95_01645 [Candidatus ainarchaeum sp.]|nr:hypothetical protein [Candidatus ainarchaeum sp.]
MPGKRFERRKEKLRRKQAAREAGIRPDLSGLVADPPAEVVHDIFLELFARNKAPQEAINEKAGLVKRIQARLAKFSKMGAPAVMLERDGALLANAQESLRIFRQLNTRFAGMDDFLHFVSRHLPRLIETQMNNEKNIERESKFLRKDLKFRIGFLFSVHGIGLGIEVLAVEIDAAKECLETAIAMRDFAKEYHTRLSGKQRAFLEGEIATYTNLLIALPKVRAMGTAERQRLLDYAKKSPWALRKQPPL